MTVSADELPDEVLATNNTRSTFVKVVSEGARVGYFDVLRPESKFIAQALEGARQLRLRRVLALPGRPLPVDQTDPDRYDVLILGDLADVALPPSRQLELKSAVQVQGKGLIVLIGPRSGGREGWRGTPAGGPAARAADDERAARRGRAPLHRAPRPARAAHRRPAGGPRTPRQRPGPLCPR